MKAILITSSILILLIMALRPILRGRIDPRIQYALWLVAALRLLVPVNLIDSAYSALALLSRAEESTQLVETIGQTALPVPGMSYQDAYDQALREYHEEQAVTTSFTDLAEVELRTQELLERELTLADLAAKYARPVWLGGAALTALWFLLVNLRLRRRLRWALPVETDCPLPVYVTPELPSPCLCGIVRPAVYVTPAAVESPDRLRHVLAHELTHYRHRDHWWALVRCLCLCLYWFDPLVWWAAALSRQDCELACDEGAIRALGEEERIPYGRTLVSMIAAGRNSLLQTATTMTGGRRRVRERVALIARRPKTVIAAALALVIILALAVGCTFTGAPGGASSDALAAQLMDVPEELRPMVQARSSDDPSCLVEYWFDAPAEWEDGQAPWLLSVYRWDRAQIDAKGYPDANDTDVWEHFAQDERWYYDIARPVDRRFDELAGVENYADAYQAIREYAEQTVLAAEGVEPWGLSADTLQARLEDIPEALRGEVALFHPDTPEMGKSDILAIYLLDNTADPDYGGRLLTVRQLDQVGFENWLYGIGAGYTDIFARDSEHYYAFSHPSDVQYSDDDAERYAAASRAIGEYARQAVLDTEGVVPYDPSELRDREYLWEDKTYADVAYWPYKAINGNMDIEWVYSMVQPAAQGRGGVWIPERVTYYDMEHDVDPTPQLIKPDTGGLTIAEYAARLQAEADAGRADWATDPVEALRHYEEETGSRKNIPLDSFTFIDGSGTGDYRPDSWLTPEQQIVYSAVSDIMASSSVELHLSIASQDAPGYYTSYTWPSDPSRDNYASCLKDLPTLFSWEEFDWGTTDDPHFPIPPSTSSSLRITSHITSAYISVWEDSDLVAVHHTLDGTNWYHARYTDDPTQAFSAYEYLRRFWFDPLELDCLHAAAITVPDRGQSHEEIARAWAEGYEGVLTKTAHGSSYQCSFMQVTDVKADLPDWLEGDELASFAQSHGMTADGFGTDWFGFSYATVFVPVDQGTASAFWAGNTWYYEEDGAPEGALTYSRIGILRLIDGNWVCEGTGTGW